MCREFARKKSSGEFARRKMNHQQPSPQSSFLSRALHASMEAAWRPKRRFLLHANRVSNVLTSVPIHGGDQSDTGGSDEQVRFCQQLGLAPPCLAPYAGQHCSCDRFVIDADHLHTCQQHSGNTPPSPPSPPLPNHTYIRKTSHRCRNLSVVATAAGAVGACRCDVCRSATGANRAERILARFFDREPRLHQIRGREGGGGGGVQKR